MTVIINRPATTASSVLLVNGTPPAQKSFPDCNYKLAACLFPLCVGWVMLGSHYARDFPGTLEEEIVEHFSIGPKRYGALNSSYYAPNLMMSVIAGALAQAYGTGRVFIACAAVASLGHGLRSYAVHIVSYGFFLTGRIALGATYQAIDSLSYPLMAPLYKENWGFAVGITTTCSRLGSVLSFAASPAVYDAAGMDAAVWVSSGLGLTGLATAALAIGFLEKKLQFFHKACAERLQEECSSYPTMSRQVSPLPGECSSYPNMTRQVSPLPGDCASYPEMTRQVSPLPEECGYYPNMTRQQEIRGLASSPPTEDSEGDSSAGFHGTTSCGMNPQGLSSLLLYFAIGMLLQAAVSPFWFYGGMFIRNKWGYSLEASDAVMLIPELIVMVLSTFVGLIIDRLTLEAQGRVLAFSTLVIAISFYTLAFIGASSLSPILPMVAFGIGYAVNHTIFWSLSSALIPSRYLAIGSGVLGGAVNIGATILPMLMAQSSSAASAISWLASLALLAAACAFALNKSLVPQSEGGPGPSQGTETACPVQHSDAP